MNLSKFSFKREAMWILIFSLGPAVVGLLFYVAVNFLR